MSTMRRMSQDVRKLRRYEIDVPLGAVALFSGLVLIPVAFVIVATGILMLLGY